jgi:peroxiredoxin
MEVAFISVDAQDRAQAGKNLYDVPFALLSDQDLVAHKAFNVANMLDGAGVERLKGYGLDIEVWSKRKHHGIAIPSMFLIDAQSRGGNVLWAHAEKNYKTRPKLDDVLTATTKLLPK